MPKIKQDFVSSLLVFSRSFVPYLYFLIDAVKYQVLKLIHSNHTCSVRVIFLPKFLKHLKRCLSNFILLIKDFSSKSLQYNCTKQVKHNEGHKCRKYRKENSTQSHSTSVNTGFLDIFIRLIILTIKKDVSLSC